MSNPARSDERYPPPPGVLENAILHGLKLISETDLSFTAERFDGKVIRVHKRTWKKAAGGRIIPREDRGISWNTTDGSLCLNPKKSLTQQRERLRSDPDQQDPLEPEPDKHEPPPPMEVAPISYSVMANQQARAISETNERLGSVCQALLAIEARLESMEALLRPLAE